MTGRYRLTIEFDTIADLTAFLEGQDAPSARTSLQQAVADRQDRPSVSQVDAAPFCPNGHGQMRYRKGGTVQAGERVGQIYPPFYSCASCRATVEIRES